MGINGKTGKIQMKLTIMYKCQVISMGEISRTLRIHLEQCQIPFVSPTMSDFIVVPNRYILLSFFYQTLFLSI